MYQAADDRYGQIGNGPLPADASGIPYVRCGRSGLQLPRISLGLWQNFGGGSPFESSRERVLRKPAVTSALIGASRWEQMEECLGALRNLQFTSEELQRIDRHALEGDLNIWAASSRAG